MEINQEETELKFREIYNNVKPLTRKLSAWEKWNIRKHIVKNKNFNAVEYKYRNIVTTKLMSVSTPERDKVKQ